MPTMVVAALLSTERGFVPIRPSLLNLALTICIGQLFMLSVLDVLRDRRWLRACIAWVARQLRRFLVRDNVIAGEDIELANTRLPGT